MSDYNPISCALHSEYELMAMHRKKVEIELSQTAEKRIGRVIDVTVRKGVEYMILLQDDGQQQELRLDHLKSVTPL